MAWPGIMFLAVAMLVAVAPTAPAAATMGRATATISDTGSGSLAGTVRSGGAPLRGVSINVSGDGAGWGTETGPNGTYLLEDLPAETFTVTASLPGYKPSTATVTVVAGERATMDFDLPLAPRRTVSGHVREDSGIPVSGAKVIVNYAAIDPVVTGADGAYVISGVPEGEWSLRVSGVPCLWSKSTSLTVTGDTTVDLVLTRKRDTYGHTCGTEPTGPADWVDVGDPLALSGHVGSTAVTLPFPVNLYDQSYRKAYVAVDGYLSFTTSSQGLWGPGAAPDIFPPNAAVYALGADLFVPENGRIRAGTLGVAPRRAFAVTWDNVTFADNADLRVSFQIVLEETGRVVLRYRGIDGPAEAGLLAGVGFEDETGKDGIQYSWNEAILADGIAVVFDVPGSAFVRGVVTDDNDRRPVPDAVVTTRQKGAPDRVVRTDADGWFQVRTWPGNARLRVTAAQYVPTSASVRVPAERAIVRRDARLRTARLTASLNGLDLVVPPGQAERRSITIVNTGGVATGWTVREVAGDPRNTASPTYPRLTAGAPALSTRPSYTGPRPPGAGFTGPVRVIRSWPATGMSQAWGVGYQAGVWVLDAYPYASRNAHFTEDGVRDLALEPWSELTQVGEMVFVPSTGQMCQPVEPGIQCWDPTTGAVSDAIHGDFPWGRGLAYRPDDDSFYISDYYSIYHVKGLSHPDPGGVIGSCTPDVYSITGLAWNRTHRRLWMATNSDTDTLYQLNPGTCEALEAVAPPDNDPYTGAGLDVDPLGRLWLVSQGEPGTVYQIDGGLPEFDNVPWLRIQPARGQLTPGDRATLTVTIDTAGLSPGSHAAYVVLVSDSGRQPEVVLPVRLRVPA